jgi:hypothetical protein
MGDPLGMVLDLLVCTAVANCYSLEKNLAEFNCYVSVPLVLYQQIDWPQSVMLYQLIVIKLVLSWDLPLFTLGTCQPLALKRWHEWLSAACCMSKDMFIFLDVIEHMQMKVNSGSRVRYSSVAMHVCPVLFLGHRSSLVGSSQSQPITPTCFLFPEQY